VFQDRGSGLNRYHFNRYYRFGCDILTAVLSRLIQLAFRFYFKRVFPNKCFFAGIGIIIILKQIPMLFMMPILKGISLLHGSNSFSSLFEVFNHIQLGSVDHHSVINHIIAWDKVPFLKLYSMCIDSGDFGIVLNEIFIMSGSSLAISNAHLVTLPVLL
jgi:hypothetical protein